MDQSQKQLITNVTNVGHDNLDYQIVNLDKTHPITIIKFFNLFKHINSMTKQ